MKITNNYDILRLNQWYYKPYESIVTICSNKTITKMGMVVNVYPPNEMMN